MKRIQLRDLHLQVLTIATVMLFVGSLATVAVPKLAGELVDVCIQVSKGSGPKDAKHQLDSTTLLSDQHSKFQAWSHIFCICNFACTVSDMYICLASFSFLINMINSLAHRRADRLSALSLTGCDRLLGFILLHKTLKCTVQANTS